MYDFPQSIADFVHSNNLPPPFFFPIDISFPRSMEVLCCVREKNKWKDPKLKAEDWEYLQ